MHLLMLRAGSGKDSETFSKKENKAFIESE